MVFLQHILLLCILLLRFCLDPGSTKWRAAQAALPERCFLSCRLLGTAATPLSACTALRGQRAEDVEADRIDRMGVDVVVHYQLQAVATRQEPAGH